MSHPMQTDPETYWNRDAGPRWIASQSMLDRVLAPVTQSIFEAAALRPGEHVVDIGCGCGSLCLEAAERVGERGRVVGVDISEPMVAHARGTIALPHVDFIVGDAQTHALEPASFDAAISRFGVMFFRDSVAAFANIAAALSPGGRIAFAVWQPLDRNTWLTWPLATIADLLPEAPVSQLDGDADLPGPFRFADPDHARHTLTAAGFGDVAIHGVEDTLAFTGTVEEILDTVTRIGPLSRALEPLDEDTAASALARVTARIRELREGDALGQPGAWWILSATR